MTTHYHYVCIVPQPPPGVYFWLYPVFEAVRYGEIQCEAYSGIQQIPQIQLDIVIVIVRYKRDRVDTVGYSGIQWICCKMARYR